MRSFAFAGTVLIGSMAAVSAAADEPVLRTAYLTAGAQGRIQPLRNALGDVVSVRTDFDRLSQAGESALAALAGAPLQETGPYRLRDRLLLASHTNLTTRTWPGLSFSANAIEVALSPYATIANSAFATSAFAGARLEISRSSDSAAARLAAMGVSDGARMGDQGRWYLFVATSGRAVGLNMLPSENGWASAGWTIDPASTLVSDVQAGVGWRKGDLQTSVGYMYRKLKSDHMQWGERPRGETLWAASVSVKPVK